MQPSVDATQERLRWVSVRIKGPTLKALDQFGNRRPAAEVALAR